jgi:tryptophan synthase alpha chain
MERIKTKSRNRNLFEHKKQNILNVFYTAGFPALHDTVRIGKCLEEAGADIIEIGIPFSDPIADGPTIQASNKRALENGMNLKLLLQQVAELRKISEIPILLMGYLNPVIQYGIEKFIQDAALAGVDGLILPDLPLAEFQKNIESQSSELGLDMVFLVSPTTSQERINLIDASSSGFVYAVSSSSTTGSRIDFSEEQEAYFLKLKNMKLKNPVLIGFGISNAATFQKACAYANGAIIGSAFINLLAESNNIETDIRKFIADIKNDLK